MAKSEHAINRNWYAVALRPGATNKARTYRKEPCKNERGYRFITVLEQEAEIERQCLREGVKLYLPMMAKEARGRRSKAWEVREAPMIPGFAFIEEPTSFMMLDKVDAISSVLGVNGTPCRVPSHEIETLKTEEAAARAEIERKIAERAKKANLVKNRLSRKDIAASYAQGTEVRANFMGFEKVGHVDGVGSNGKVKVLMEFFGSLTPVDVDPSEIISTEAA